jgi:hypothetical protein
MSKLSFQLAFKSGELQSLDLPIEVRKPNLALVTKTFSSKSVELKPGQYFVSATLPAGQELYTQVDVGDIDTTAILQPEPQDESPHESHERQLFMSMVPFRSLDSSLLESLGGAPLEASIGLLRGGDLRTALRVPLPVLHFEKIDAGLQFKIPGGAFDQPQFLELLRPGSPPRHIALPVGSGQVGLVVIRRVPAQVTDDLIVDVHIQNGEADLLLCGLGRGYLREAAQAVNSEEITAEKLLKGKEGDPFGAAVGAYSLLQFGELDRLHDWTTNLMNQFTWLPDGLSIRGEHLARMGRHQEALAIFAELPSRGIPQFSIGISYAVNRLRIYTRTTRTHFEPNVLDKAGKAFEYLENVSEYVDFRRPVLTTEGIRSDEEYPSGTDIGLYL